MIQNNDSKFIPREKRIKDKFLWIFSGVDVICIGLGAFFGFKLAEAFAPDKIFTFIVGGIGFTVALLIEDAEVGLPNYMIIYKYMKYAIQTKSFLYRQSRRRKDD